MKALEQLQDEHRSIERMLDRVSEALDPMDGVRVSQALEFFGTFTDHLHHGKEEEILFHALLTKAPDTTKATIQSIQREHAMGRAYLRSARELLPKATSGDAKARKKLVEQVRGYVSLVRRHLKKENEVLYPMASEVLSSGDDARLLKDMSIFTQRAVTAETLEHLQMLAEDPRRVETVIVRPRKSERETVDLVGESALDGPPRPISPDLDAKTLSTLDVETTEDQDETAMYARRDRFLYDRDGHVNVLLHDFGRGLAVQANQYLIVRDGAGLILDPGGPKVYPSVLAETHRHVGEDGLKYLFLSHQDPDIATALNAWLMDTDADAYISQLWFRFMPHFGIDKLLRDRLRLIADEGAIIDLSGAELYLIPAHFLHSCGNFQLYNPTSKVLFSGDLGASMGVEYTKVTDFNGHIEHMVGFHRRYMGSNAAMQAWARMARNLDIETIAPQHGAILEGKELVGQFIDWCESLQCGIDCMSEVFRVPTKHWSR